MGRSFTVGDDARIDAAVAKAAGLSRAQARRLIAAGQVAVNSKVVKVLSREVRKGQRLTVNDDGAPEPERGLEVLFQDRWLVVVNKPAGLLSQPAREGGGPTVVELVRAALPGNRPYVALVHRLDAGTSGAMMLSLAKDANEPLGDLFRRREVDKRYTALASGTVAGPLHLTGAIGRDPAQPERFWVRDNADAAESWVTPVRAFAHATLVEVTLGSGRTHQARVHLAHAGHPLVGDRLYGGPRVIAGLAVRRTLLHAQKLGFRHPFTKNQLSVEAPLAPDFAAILERLEKEDL